MLLTNARAGARFFSEEMKTHDELVAEARECAANGDLGPIAEDMTPEQQIERLIEQRNALWRLLHGIMLSDKHDEARDLCESLRNLTDEATNLAKRMEEMIGEEDPDKADVEWAKVEEIVGNTYIVEGVNHATGDVEREVGLYTRVAAKIGGWLMNGKLTRG